MAFAAMIAKMDDPRQDQAGQEVGLDDIGRNNDGH